MRPIRLRPASRFSGEVRLPGDKSIAHRAVFISAIANGATAIENFPANRDCLETIKIFKKLGVKIKARRSSSGPGSLTVIVSGQGLTGLKKPASPLFAGESGTTLRMLLGILSGQKFQAIVKAAPSLSKRPMRRVTGPLRLMGADIWGEKKTLSSGAVEEYPPVKSGSSKLAGITYRMPVASAQVKSALLFAGLYANGPTRIMELSNSRDHTERMLRLFKAKIKTKGRTVILRPVKKLISPLRMYVPGDISSAAFFIVPACILPDSKVRVRDVSLNPSRLGLIKVLKRMKADIAVSSKKNRFAGFEPIGDITARSSALEGTRVLPAEIPSLIDELPVLMVAACFARGRTVFQGIGELRVKETNRINSMSVNLRRMGADIKVVKRNNREDIIVRGIGGLKGCRLKSFNDHRTAMSLIIAALKAEGASFLDDVTCLRKSFPDFIKLIRPLVK